MPRERVPTDVYIDQLVALFARATRRLEEVVNLGLRRGLDPDRVGQDAQIRGDATLHYRRQQLLQAQAILTDLRRQAGAHVAHSIQATYQATLRAVEQTVGEELRAAVSFGSIHVRAVEALSTNMAASLAAAVEMVGGNLEDVFARADAIEGALRLDRPSPGPVPFIGRRLNDPYRRLALENVAQGLIGMDGRRGVSRALARDLVNEGVTDAVTGFVDRAGRRWPLDVYTKMVARTTTREATTRATVNRLLEGDLPIVTVDSHPHVADECDDYDGQTFALTSRAAAELGLPQLDELPPFHPNCLHVLTPGEGNIDRFTAALAADTV